MHREQGVHSERAHLRFPFTSPRGGRVARAGRSFEYVVPRDANEDQYQAHADVRAICPRLEEMDVAEGRLDVESPLVQLLGIGDREIPVRRLDQESRSPERPLPRRVDPRLFVFPVLEGGPNPESSGLRLGRVGGLFHDSLKVAPRGTAPEEKEVVFVQEPQGVGGGELPVENHRPKAQSSGKILEETGHVIRGTLALVPQDDRYHAFLTPLEELRGEVTPRQGRAVFHGPLGRTSRHLFRVRRVPVEVEDEVGVGRPALALEARKLSREQLKMRVEVLGDLPL